MARTTVCSPSNRTSRAAPSAPPVRSSALGVRERSFDRPHLDPAEERRLGEDEVVVDDETGRHEDQEPPGQEVEAAGEHGQRQRGDQRHDDARGPLPGRQQQRTAGDGGGHEEPQEGERAEDEGAGRAERVASLVAVGRALAEGPADARAEDGDHRDGADDQRQQADQVRIARRARRPPPARGPARAGAGPSGWPWSGRARRPVRRPTGPTARRRRRRGSRCSYPTRRAPPRSPPSPAGAATPRGRPRGRSGPSGQIGRQQHRLATMGHPRSTVR